MSVRQGNNTIAGATNYIPDLLDWKWADHILDNVSWLRGDTFSWQPGTVYTRVYSHLSADITGKTLQTETISGIAIQFYLADDGHKICPASEESNVTAIYNATGVAWYYIIDTTSQKFKLPRTKFGFTGLRDGAGNYVAPGLPNITGWAQLNDDLAFQNSGGAITLSNSYSRDVAGNRSSSQNHNFNLDASRSSSIYGNSTTVQPPATQMYLYFYVGRFTQSAVAQTAGLNTELFNGKLDITTFNTDGVKYCSYNTDTRIKITTTATAATKSGWLIGTIAFSGTNKAVTVYVNSTLVWRSGWSTGSQWFAASVCLPLKEGQTYRFYCDGTVEQNDMYFYPDD